MVSAFAASKNPCSQDLLLAGPYLPRGTAKRRLSWRLWSGLYPVVYGRWTDNRPRAMICQHLRFNISAANRAVSLLVNMGVSERVYFSDRPRKICNAELNLGDAGCNARCSCHMQWHDLPNRQPLHQCRLNIVAAWRADD